MHSFDWHAIFAMSATPQELLLRGTVMYWFLFLVFRFILRRDTGSAGVSDILFVVLLGDAAQNGMIGEAMGVGDAVFLISVLVGWNYLLDYLAYYFKPIEWLTAPPPLCLVRNGRKLRANMRKEHLTDGEIEGKLRDAGVDRLSDVKRMYLESGGEFTVLRRRKG
jgi:uncharacterized membrane protein YcaP (DUF421 family)